MKTTVKVQLEVRDNVAHVSLNRPDKHNGLDEKCGLNTLTFLIYIASMWLFLFTCNIYCFKSIKFENYQYNKEI